MTSMKLHGIYPISYPAMQRRFKLFHDGGINREIPAPVWIQAQEIITTEILTLPPHPNNRPRRRTTLDANRRLFTREMLDQLEN